MPRRPFIKLVRNINHYSLCYSVIVHALWNGRGDREEKSEQDVVFYFLSSFSIIVRANFSYLTTLMRWTLNESANTMEALHPLRIHRHAVKANQYGYLSLLRCNNNVTQCNINHRPLNIPVNQWKRAECVRSSSKYWIGCAEMPTAHNKRMNDNNYEIDYTRSLTMEYYATQFPPRWTCIVRNQNKVVGKSDPAKTFFHAEYCAINWPGSNGAQECDREREFIEHRALSLLGQSTYVSNGVFASSNWFFSGHL